MQNSSIVEELPPNEEEMKSDSEILKKSLTSSPIKSQAERVEEEGGVISETFFGKQTTYIYYKDKNDEEKF